MGHALAQQTDLDQPPGFYDITSVELIEVQPFADPLEPIIPGGDDDTTPPFPKPGPGPTFPPLPGNGGIFRPGGGVFNPVYGNRWMMIGQVVYQLVKENEPMANADTERLSVLPIDENQWDQMEGWTGPHVRTFNLRAKNGFGMNVVNFQYQVILYANGKHNDKGKYLANLQIVPQFVDVSWGFKFDSLVEVGDVMNMGTTEDPIVGMHMQIQYKIHSMMKHSQGIDSFFVKGDSHIEKIP